MSPTLRVVYSRSPSIGSVLIRMADRWGQWSHCGLISERETVLEALAFKGVVETRTEDFFERVSHYEIVDFAVPSAAAGLRWAREQLGKGYDYGALFGNLFREPWQDDSRHDCAEFVEWALIHAGRMRFRSPAWKLSPNLSFMVRCQAQPHNTGR